jgi:two-component system chemotaxis response regulator CheB
VTLGELEGDEPGVPVEIVCPHCQGALTVSEMGGFQVFRCHVGHAFSFDTLALEQGEEVERALWAAARALEEGASITRRARARASGEVARRLAEKEEAQLQHAQRIRDMLLQPGREAAADVQAAADPGESRTPG